MSNNSGGIGTYFLGFLGVVFGCILVWGIIEAVTRPSVIWFILGIIATLFIEGLVILIRRFVRFLKTRKNPRDTEE